MALGDCFWFDSRFQSEQNRYDQRLYSLLNITTKHHYQTSLPNITINPLSRCEMRTRQWGWGSKSELVEGKSLHITSAGSINWTWNLLLWHWGSGWAHNRHWARFTSCIEKLVMPARINGKMYHTVNMYIVTEWNHKQESQQLNVVPKGFILGKQIY